MRFGETSTGDVLEQILRDLDVYEKVILNRAQRLRRNQFATPTPSIVGEPHKSGMAPGPGAEPERPQSPHPGATVSRARPGRRAP